VNAVINQEQSKPTVLIVDDEQAQRESLRQLVVLSGYEAETVNDGLAAIEALKLKEYDVLLLDINMPRMTGMELIENICNQALSMKVIVVSGESSFDNARKALKLGAYDFLKKPYLPDELLTTVKNASHKKHLEAAHELIQQKLNDSENLHRFIVDHSPDIVFMLDKEGRFTFLNDTVYKILGYEKGELIGEHYSTIVSNQSKDQARHVFQERRTGDRKSRQIELKLKCRDDADYRFLETTSVSVNLSGGAHGQGEVNGTYGVARDVTERKHAQEVINFQAYHDMLTRLPNRVLLEDRLKLAITHAARSKELVAIMFLDLDRFKWVNDTLGHTIGDRLLQSVSQRLEACLRKGDTLARFGGDEFAIVLPELHHQEDAEIVANKILEGLKSPFMIDKHELYVTGSIGIALYPEAGETLESLIKSADVAMYHIKERGKNGYEFYREEMNESSNTRLTLERELRRALANDHLTVCYQPQVNADSEEVVGFEALVRWIHPEQGTVFPNDFIPIAEETGLILEIGNFVLKTACRDLKKWRDRGLKNVRVSVNCSAMQVEQADFINTISEALSEHQIPAECLEVEITENLIMNDMADVISKMRELTELGIKIAVDDFGTGYSSLSYLQQFPVNTLKIDKSFVSSINVSEEGSSIVDAIVAMAKGLKLHLIAEGVETGPQLEYLRSLGCNDIQGWLYGKAEDAATTQLLLESLIEGQIQRHSVTS